MFSWEWSKKNVFFWKKNSKWPTQKNLIFQLCQFSIFFMKISWIGPWGSRIDWCKGHWCGSTYLVVRLFNISSKTGKKCIFCVFDEFSFAVFFATVLFTVRYLWKGKKAKCFSVHNSSFLLQHAYLDQSTLCVFCMCCSESVILRIKGSVFCCKSCHFRVSDPQTRNVNSVNRSRTTCKLSRYQSCRF